MAAQNGRNNDFHSKKLVLSSLIGIWFVMLEMTKMGVVVEEVTTLEEDEEEDAAEEGIDNSGIWI